MSFSESLKSALSNEVGITENGAVGFANASSEILTMNFMLSSLRNESDDDISKRFSKVFFENPNYAVKFLFFVGDIRGGCGERRTFRICFDWLVDNKTDVAKRVLRFIPEYTRWDNLVRLIGSKVGEDVVKIVAEQLRKDISDMKGGKSVSLLAKWMPSANTSSSVTKALARKWIAALGISPAAYRKMLARLRSHIDVVEVKMSSRKFSDINYETVPSRANLLYKDAFMRRDGERRSAYLESVKSGEAKINASEAVFPHDILHKMYSQKEYVAWNKGTFKDDPTVEAMWNALPNKLKDGDGGVMCVVDSSGSMTSTIGGTNVSAWEVAHALGFYFAQHCNGDFKDKYITFSSKPEFVDMTNCKTLKDRLTLAESKSLYDNTNIEAVFDLVLTTAVRNGMNQSEIPSTILIFSDCEFDAQCYAPSVCDGNHSNYGKYWDANGNTLFDAISKKFEGHGYHMPKLVFWNLCSRSGTVPLQQSAYGLVLISGFSANNVDMVMENELNPYKVLAKKLDSDRYKPIAEVVGNIVENA